MAKEDFSGVIAFPSFNYECIEACGMEYIEKLNESIDSLTPFSEERDAFAMSILGNAMQISVDGDGRIKLPEKLIECAKLEDSAIFVGKGRTFEIWNPKMHAEMADKAREFAKANRQALSLS